MNEFKIISKQMNEQLLEINASKKHDEIEEENLVYIRISQEKHFKVNISILVSQLKYIHLDAIHNLSDVISQLQKTIHLTFSEI